MLLYQASVASFPGQHPQPLPFPQHPYTLSLSPAAQTEEQKRGRPGNEATEAWYNSIKFMKQKFFYVPIIREFVVGYA